MSSTFFGSLACCLGLVAWGCSRAPQTPRPELVEKGRYQALYAADGSLERVVWDSDADGRAEAVLLYGPRGRVRLAEIDTDGDGRVDRWEHYDAAGRLQRVER